VLEFTDGIWKREFRKRVATPLSPPVYDESMLDAFMARLLFGWIG